MQSSSRSIPMSKEKGKNESIDDGSTSDLVLDENHFAHEVDYSAIRSIQKIMIPGLKQMKLVSSSMTKQNKETVTVYEVVVETRGFNYRILKRFKDFCQLQDVLKSRYKICFSMFPSKVTILKSQETVLRERKMNLEMFLNFLLNEALNRYDSVPFHEKAEPEYEIPEFFDFLEMTTCKRYDLRK